MLSYKSLDTSLLHNKNMTLIITGFFVINLLATLLSAATATYLLKQSSSSRIDEESNDEMKSSSSSSGGGGSSSSSSRLAKRFGSLKIKICKYFSRIDNVLDNAEKKIKNIGKLNNESKVDVSKLVEIISESNEYL